jgi:hypothetical protein
MRSLPSLVCANGPARCTCSAAGRTLSAMSKNSSCARSRVGILPDSTIFAAAPPPFAASPRRLASRHPPHIHVGRGRSVPVRRYVVCTTNVVRPFPAFQQPSSMVAYRLCLGVPSYGPLAPPSGHISRSANSHVCAQIFCPFAFKIFYMRPWLLDFTNLKGFSIMITRTALQRAPVFPHIKQHRRLTHKICLQKKCLSITSSGTCSFIGVQTWRIFL